MPHVVFSGWVRVVYAVCMELSMSQRKAVTLKKAAAYRRGDRKSVV